MGLEVCAKGLSQERVAAGGRRVLLRMERANDVRSVIEV